MPTWWLAAWQQAHTFFNPAAQAVVPALTTEGQRLAANSVAWSTGRLVSPKYFPLWLRQLISSFGDTLHYIALVVLVFRASAFGISGPGRSPGRRPARRQLAVAARAVNGLATRNASPIA